MSEKKRRKPRQRSYGARLAGACLYALLVVVISAVLATVGWTWANDLLALDKEYTSTIFTVPTEAIVTVEVTDEEGNVYLADRADLDLITQQLKDEGLINHKFLFRLYAWFSKYLKSTSGGSAR